MRPRTFFCAAIVDHSNSTVTWRLLRLCWPRANRRCLPFFVRAILVLNGYAIDIVALERLAGGFRAVLVEAGEAGAIEHRRALAHALGKGLAAGEELAGLALDAGEALLGLALARIGTDLDDPAAARVLWP